MNLSKNFTLEELVFSPTAIRNKFVEQSNPPANVVDNLTVLCNKVLEPIRAKFGVTLVSSAYRCPRLNTKVKGSPSSHHMLGMAADINFGKNNKKLYEFIRDNLKYTQLIWEYGSDENPDWVHVAFDANNLSMVETRIR